ncbi:MAG: phosphatidylserine decarboxylase [Burkholderiales bacterium]|nr:phosphatidylserine decarboxylase [Burkholderiales bacterium]
MKYYPHPIIAREGWLFIIISLIITLIIYNLSNFWVTLPFILISLFIIQFFRDPKRIIPAQPNIILSPADGKIIAIEETHDVYQNVRAMKISIFMNIFNVHSNRSPVDGEVTHIEYYPGKFINADFDKASTENERNAMVIRLANGQKITVVQVAGLIARRILCYVRVGNVLSRGQRYGFIRFGSRVDVYLPLDARILVSIGQKAVATETILAKLEQ